MVYPHKLCHSFFRAPRVFNNKNHKADASRTGQIISPRWWSGAKFIFMVLRRKRSLLKKIIVNTRKTAWRSSRPCEILVCLFSGLQNVRRDFIRKGSGLSTNHSPLFKHVSLCTVYWRVLDICYTTAVMVWYDEAVFLWVSKTWPIPNADELSSLSFEILVCLADTSIGPQLYL